MQRVCIPADAGVRIGQDAAKCDLGEKPVHAWLIVVTQGERNEVMMRLEEACAIRDVGL